MRGINKVILIGNATRDPELRKTSNGKPVANLRLATNRMVGDKELTQFHTVICWERLAETVTQYVKKGDPVYVEGRLGYRTFQDEEGKERGVAEVIANDVQFLSRKSSAAEAAAVPAPSESADLSVDEIPF